MTKKNLKALLVCALLIAAAVALVFLRGNSARDEVLAYINGDPLTKEEYSYYLNAELYDVAAYLTEDGIEEYLSGDAGGITVEESLKNAILNDARQIRAIETEYEKLGFDFGETSGEALSELMAESFEYYGGEESLRTMLKDEGLEFSVFERQQKAAVMADVLEYELFESPSAPYAVTDGDMREAYEANWALAKHILISTLDENAQPVSDEARAEKRAFAESLLERVRAGEDTDALIAEFGEDPGMEANPEGYLFTWGETDSIFEEAVFALAPGEISELTESRYGFHIIKRYPLEYKEAYESIKEDVNLTARRVKMGDLMRDWAESLEVEIFNDRIESDEELSPAAALGRILRDIAEQ
jgi:hypothetical protein